MSGKITEKTFRIDLKLSVWNWCREEAGKLGMRGVKPFVESLVLGAKESGAIDELGAVESEDEAGKLTSRELTEKKQNLIDNWVLGQLSDEETLNSLPKQTQAAIIMQRLPKMGVDKGSFEEKALSLRTALSGLADYEDIQGELVTLREEVGRLSGEVEFLEGVVDGIQGSGKLDEKSAMLLALCMGWRERVRDALRGRLVASGCSLLRKDKLVEIWKKGAMEVAGDSLGVEMFEKVKDGDR